MVCSACKNIFLGDLPPLYDEVVKSNDVFKDRASEQRCIRPFHEDISELCQGALNGCQICDIIWRHFFRDKTPQEYTVNPAFLRNGEIHRFFGSGTHYRIRRPDKRFRGDYTLNALELEVGLNSPMDRDIPQYKSIMLAPVEDEPSVSMRNLPSPDVSIYGENTWATIQKWLSDCKKNHSKCNTEDSSPAWYPTRLLDLKYEYNEDPVEQLAILIHLMLGGCLPADVRLIETASTSPVGPYMTLSHRWTSSGISIKTEKSNVEQRKRRIPAKELPPIFEQAIQFARRLGVRYLWIDSLCIIQGDEEDWKYEAMTMSDVYSNSFLNLSATAAGTSLIPARDPRLIDPCIIEPRWTGKQPISYVISDFRFWEDRIHKSICNQRAWITQERWLSPRVLHFAFDQLVWECREFEAAETFPQGLSKEAKSNPHTSFKQERIKAPTREGIQSPHRLRYYDWCKVLETYGRSEVTYGKDRLVAIAGVAEKLSEILNDKWVAGLWKRTLPGDLLWEVRKGMRTNKPPAETGIVERQVIGARPAHQVNWSERLGNYQAPSWSWASVLGDIVPGVFVEQESEDAMISILDISVTPLDPKQPLGRLKAAHLKLRGTLYPLAMDPPDWPGDQPSWRCLPPTIHITGLAKRKKKPLWEGAPQYMMHSHIAHIHPDEPVDYFDVGRSCFLPVAKNIYRNPGDEIDGAHLVYGLCLLPTGKKKGEYQRIGRMDFVNEDCALFEDGLEVQRLGGDASGLRAHPPSLDSSLYEDGMVGVFSII